MTPQEINEYARQQYNSVGDTFFTDPELFKHTYTAQMQLAMQTNCIRRIYTASTVVSQQEYSKPANSIMIKRITYNGYKLQPITMREDDAVSLNNQATLSTGTPQYYFEWGTSVFLRPVPDTIGTLKIFSYNQPQAVTSNSTLEVPERYHLYIVDFLLGKKATKDRNYEGAALFMAQWRQNLVEAKAYERKMLRGDGFSGVQDIDSLPTTLLGMV